MQLIFEKNLEQNLYSGARVVHPFVCGWFVISCDVCQAVGDRALGDLCVCVRCGSDQSQKV